MAKDALFEIGLEELPARFVDDAEQQLLEKTEIWLKELRISFASVTSYSTPRRIAVFIQDMAEEQTTIEEEAKGPAEKIAKDAEGNWTKAAIGFTKGQGKTPDDIYTKEINGTSYIFVKKHIDGKQTKELLPGFKEIILALQFAKNMRWGKQTLRYARPIRWLVALFDNEIIPFEIAGVRTGNQTFGHRFLGKPITLVNPNDYAASLAQNYVIADAKQRENLIVNGIKELERKEGFHIPVSRELLNEVRNLVEYPTVFMGSFDESFLKLPSEVLITSMAEHQRYFPVKSKDGHLLPHFVGVRNGDDYKLQTVVKGNEKVLKARLSDAQFFYEEDHKHSVNHYLQKLEKVVFQEKLGTISDKVNRIMHITEKLAEMLNVDNVTKQRAVRAAQISKFDLVTNMVNEFTELQGIMGEKYAMNFGEEKTVAKAVAEHYMPRHANGKLPESAEGSIVSVADKLDTIVGCISVGYIPTGSQDPYGLRRQALGILKTLQKNEWNITVESLLDITLDLYQTLDIEIKDVNKVSAELNEFFLMRASYLMKEMSIPQDIIQAVLYKQVGIVGYTMEKASILSEKRNDADFKQVQEAFTRVLNLSKKAQFTEVDELLFETASEQELFQQYLSVSADYLDKRNSRDANLALEQISKLAEPIHTFFEHNMVMAEDEKLRKNRLSLIRLVAKLIYDFADMTRIEWKQHF
ncbi:glycine--tRNA ligase subunit beta [Virgibacillus oceani]|uniref:Glycine--tRNA ligase beta subunit n=1 Tax=Virgibacillus oceani TaxID=1479511 RepID=A0A917LXE3_9BACI|nr:glycine--tRNA ligase subunit beta [Virgibacillus oceani]GGG63430.1 glycine--tRNA ligase beta subunit [Virgibacillus oceani]